MLDVEVVPVPATETARTLAGPPPPGARILDGDVRLVLPNGEVAGFQKVLDPAPWQRDIKTSLDRVPWAGGAANRMSGFGYHHITFGSVPPNPLRKRFGCSPCRFNRLFPRTAGLLERYTELAWDTLQAEAPEAAARHLAAVEHLPRGWRMGRAPWTSGIANRTAALPYHRDGGNVRGSWSAMLALREGVDGGLLHMPELDVWLAIPDRSLTVFDGQAQLHAVTPLAPRDRRAYRFTIVTYAKSQMAKCLEGEAEVRRAQVARTASEERIAGYIAARRG